MIGVNFSVPKNIQFVKVRVGEIMALGLLCEGHVLFFYEGWNFWDVARCDKVFPVDAELTEYKYSDLVEGNWFLVHKRTITTTKALDEYVSMFGNYHLFLNKDSSVFVDFDGDYLQVVRRPEGFNDEDYVVWVVGACSK